MLSTYILLKYKSCRTLASHFGEPLWQARVRIHTILHASNMQVPWVFVWNKIKTWCAKYATCEQLHFVHCYGIFWMSLCCTCICALCDQAISMVYQQQSIMYKKCPISTSWSLFCCWPCLWFLISYSIWGFFFSWHWNSLVLYRFWWRCNKPLLTESHETFQSLKQCKADNQQNWKNVAWH